MRKIKIDRNYYDENIRIYKKGIITLESGLTVLIGCNGSGKTTLIKQISGTLKRENIPYLHFDNLHDGGVNARAEAGLRADYEFVAQSVFSSEGEEITLNLVQFSRKIGKILRETDDNEAWILFDAIDSGLSVDSIVDLKKGLFDTIFETNPDKDIYIIAAANEYELARGEKCFDVINCRYVSIKSYEKYRNVILKSKEQKNDRYKESMYDEEE